MALAVAPVQPPDLPAVVVLWNACLGTSHPLGGELLEAFVGHPRHQPELFLQLREEGRLCGAVACAAPQAPWTPADLGYVSFLAVAPACRGRGLGRRLLAEASARLRAVGCRRVRFGGAPDHLLPGVPVEADAATWRFLRAAGLRFGEVVHDLELDLTLPLAAAGLRPELALRADGSEEALAFVARVFPGRWQEDVDRALRAGAPVLRLVREGETLGFAAVYPADSLPIGPSRHWVGDRSTCAGLGPIGIDPVLRGQGQGLAFFAAAARWLQQRGAERLIVDWTTLCGFYGRVGAHVWRSYQQVEGALEAPPARQG